MRVLITIVFMVFSAISIAQEKAARVVVEKVQVKTIEDTTPVIARLIAKVESEIAARREGIVKSVDFHVGDTVTKGQILARLDEQLAGIELQNAEASLAAAKAGVTVARSQVLQSSNALDRQSGLQGSAAFAQGRFEDLEQEAAQAQGELARANAEMAVSQAAVARAAYDVTHSTINAPFDGVITDRVVQTGQFISLGGAVAMILDLGELEIEADVPTNLLDGLSIGREIQATLQDSTKIVAKVRSILPVETISTRTRPVRLTINLSKVKPYLLAKGKTVTISAPVSKRREIVVVPKDALVQSLEGGWQVFVAREEKSVQVPITLGQASGDGFEVLDGLVADDLVVVRGNERLRPGQSINPVFDENSENKGETKS
ncbi:MAG: efflux RND transporter periplasmic adaptor subunit [Pseudomonadota bacterium]